LAKVRKTAQKAIGLAWKSGAEGKSLKLLEESSKHQKDVSPEFHCFNFDIYSIFNGFAQN